jgi:hypothetical protein
MLSMQRRQFSQRYCVLCSSPSCNRVDGHRYCSTRFSLRTWLSFSGWWKINPVSEGCKIPSLSGMNANRVDSSDLGMLWLSLILQERHRKRRMRAGLPDALDLMWFYNKAGLPLDMAIAKVSKLLGNLRPDLSEELYLTSREMRSGMSRDDALYNLSERTGIDETKALTASGLLGILQALHMQSYSLRAGYCQRLKRQTSKGAFVLTILLLPLVILVTLGPTMIELFRISQGH